MLDSTELVLNRRQLNLTLYIYTYIDYHLDPRCVPRDPLLDGQVDLLKLSCYSITCENMQFKELGSIFNTISTELKFPDESKSVQSQSLFVNGSRNVQVQALCRPLHLVMVAWLLSTVLVWHEYNNEVLDVELWRLSEGKFILFVCLCCVASESNAAAVPSLARQEAHFQE